MATIETALGPIEDSQLGFTLSHEHVMTSGGEDLQHYPWMFDLKDAMTRATAALVEAKAGGVDSFIDLSTPDLGRDVSFVAEASRASGIHIVVATGMWRDIPRSFHTRDLDDIADIFVREIEVGIGTTDIKAGAIKVANDVDGITPPHERVLRGAARACTRTGRPISTHHWAPMELGREQVRIFKEEGVQMDRVCIGHSADTTDVAYLEALLNEGVYLSMDRYPGREGRVQWQERNATVKALIDRGWAHRIMLGHDFPVVRLVNLGSNVPPDTYNPDGLLFLTRVAIPALIADGVPRDTIDLMMREVPREFLTGEKN